jgi:TetR/AcrR family transcriptional regulator, lmrAB and yxaGH operons repressor
MQSNPVNYRQNMIRMTALLLPSKGLAGLSLVEVGRMTGAPRGSLYHYFPGGWEELLQEALALAQGYGLALIESVPTATTEPAALIEGLGQTLKKWFKKSAFNGGCPVGAAALSAGDDEVKIRAQCADIFTSWTAALAVRFQTAGVAKAQASDLAQGVLDGFQGALLRARAQKSAAPIDVAVRNLILFASLNEAKKVVKVRPNKGV